MSTTPLTHRLLVVGLNHKTAPLPVREALAFSPAQLPAALAAFKTAYPHAEAVLLSTCNRVELYISSPAPLDPTIDHLINFLAHFHHLPPTDFLPHLYHHQDRAMVEHLFRVTASLDSMVVGETQILAQVKSAYQSASTHGTIHHSRDQSRDHKGATESLTPPHAPPSPAPPRAGAEPPPPPTAPAASPAPLSTQHSALKEGGGTPSPIFHVLFQRALAAAKSIHDQTDLAAGRISIASVAVDLAASVFDRFDDKTVLCIGAGKMSALLLRHLSALNPKHIRITNRTPEHAATLAAQFHATPVPIASLHDLLIEADIILTSTGSPDPIITAPQFKALLKPRRYRPLVIVDIAVPRDVDPALADLPNIYLYNIDDLQQIAASNLSQRSTQIDLSHDLLTTHVEDFLHWLASRETAPLIKSLYEEAHAAANAELATYLQKHPHLSNSDREDLTRMLHRLIAKTLHTPITRLTHQSRTTPRPPSSPPND